MGYTGAAWQIARTVTARQGAYAVASLMARYDVNDKLSVTLNVQNLFDRKYIASNVGLVVLGDVRSAAQCAGDRVVQVLS
ncbi:hypothetical protein ACSFBX_27770 [Variovorax sp. RB2P76]|uniref:hypothetical protein n=1 Tax=unclassified Variovorax TaxID=663243 RepID=UPI003F479119